MEEENKNIVIFNKNIPAGVSTILKNIIRYSANREIPYRLILYQFDDPNHHLINEDWCEDVERIKLSGYDNLYHTLKKLERFVDKNSIIVANDLPELRMAVLLKLPNPLIYIIHGDFVVYYQHCEQFQDYLDLIIAYSSHIEEKLRLLLKPENRKKIKLLYYPVPEIKMYIRNHFSGYIKLIFVGSLIERKGVSLLPGIISGLDALKTNYQLKIIGSGEMEKWLKEQLFGNNRVVFEGQKSNDQVIELFNSNDILLFPTRSEGLPNVLVEAMKSGCVPVVSDIPSGIPDVVEHGKNGFLVPIDDVEGFVKQINILNSDRELLYVTSQSAKEKANRMFEPYKNAIAYYNAFCEIKSKTIIPDISIKKGPLLNVPYLPNRIVRAIRKLHLNPNL